MNSWMVDAGRRGGSGRGRLGWVVTVGREEGEGGLGSWERRQRRVGQGRWKSMQRLQRGRSDVRH